MRNLLEVYVDEPCMVLKKAILVYEATSVRQGCAQAFATVHSVTVNDGAPQLDAGVGEGGGGVGQGAG